MKTHPDNPHQRQSQPNTYDRALGVYSTLANARHQSADTSLESGSLISSDSAAGAAYAAIAPTTHQRHVRFPSAIECFDLQNEGQAILPQSGRTDSAAPTAAAAISPVTAASTPFVAALAPTAASGLVATAFASAAAAFAPAAAAAPSKKRTSACLLDPNPSSNLRSASSQHNTATRRSSPILIKRRRQGSSKNILQKPTSAPSSTPNNPKDSSPSQSSHQRTCADRFLHHYSSMLRSSASPTLSLRERHELSSIFHWIKKEIQKLYNLHFKSRQRFAQHLRTLQPPLPRCPLTDKIVIKSPMHFDNSDIPFDGQEVRKRRKMGVAMPSCQTGKPVEWDQLRAYPCYATQLRTLRNQFTQSQSSVRFFENNTLGMMTLLIANLESREHLLLNSVNLSGKLRNAPYRKLEDTVRLDRNQKISFKSSLFTELKRVHRITESTDSAYTISKAHAISMLNDTFIDLTFLSDGELNSCVKIAFNITCRARQINAEAASALKSDIFNNRKNRASTDTNVTATKNTR